MTVTVTVVNVGIAERLEMLNNMLGSAFLAWFLDTEVVNILQRQAANRFGEQGEDVGGWLPLAMATVEIRESQGFPGEHPINIRTGELEAWVTQAGGESVPLAGSGAIMHWPGEMPGNGELYEKYTTAQEGKAWRNTPARPVVAIVADDLLFTMGALAGFLETAGVDWI